MDTRARARNSDAMPGVSSTVATFVFVWAVTLFANRVPTWQRVPAWELVSTAGVSAYAAVAMIAGWRYVATGRKVFGWIHSVQMLVVAIASVPIMLYCLVLIPRLGYSGPAAGPGIGGVLILGAMFLAAIVCVVFGGCGLGVLRHISLQSKSEASAVVDEETLNELSRRFPYCPKR